MVGTVVFKDFETGSYKNIRLVVYEGTSYSDVGNGSFVSCLVDVDKEKIVYDIKDNKASFEVQKEDIIYIARQAREYLYQNTHVTIAEYTYNGDECSFRSVSVKCGVYQPADLINLFTGKVFYKLISKKPDKTFLWCSTHCELLNFAFQRVFGVSEWVYCHSGYGIYFNIACLPLKITARMGLGAKMLFNLYRRPVVKIKFRKACKEITEPEYTPYFHPYKKLLSLSSRSKLRAAKRLLVLIDGKTTAFQRWKAAQNLAEDEYIISLTDSLVEEIDEYSSNYSDWGYLKAVSHKDVLEFREVFNLSVDTDLMDNISKVAAARSVNNKFLKKLPCPEFLDGDGNAINIKGEQKQ